MKFNRTMAEPLLLWMNTMFPEEPIWEFIHMTNGIRLLEICCKLSGEENFEGFKTSSLYKKLEVILCVLHDNFNLTKRQSSLILQKINQGIDLELQLAKVALLLCYCSFKKGGLLSMDSESEIISMFRFIKDDADGLSLDEGLDQFLDQDSVMNGGSSDRSLLYTDEESPNVGRVQRFPRVQFQELCTVASSSDRSPVQDVMNTPQFQLKRLRKELAHEGDVRDELEKELSDQINIISEKEGLIIQLQHRVDRLLREQEQLEKDHKDALLELQEKNESLLRRVHEVVKQCQDLKTENSQKDKKIDELTEENHTFAAQVRNAFAQLARAEEEVTKLTLAHESSQAEWKSKKEFLEHKLNEAVSHKECLSEQVQILQGKISVLEDELQKAQSQEKGEVLGPIMEWEKLKQELADLTLKLTELQDTISRLEKEKAEVEILLAEERASFEKETGRLQMVVLDLEQSVNSIRLERETLEEALQSQKEMLTAQISALESDVSRLQLVEIQLTTEIKISTDLRQQREELEAKVVSLDKKVHVLYAEIQGLETERESQQDSLNALVVELQSAKNTVQDYEKKIESNCKEHEETVKKLQQELQSASSAASENQEEIQVLSAEVTSLKEQICRYIENEVLKQQQMSVLETQNNVMQQNLSSLQNQLFEATTIASHKDSELLLLQNELLQQESLRKKAQELESAKREELERTVSELQAKIQEVSTLASEREAQVISLQNDMKDQKLSAKQSEDDLRRELEEKVGTLRGELDAVNRCAADKDNLLGSLDQKMKEMEGLFLQKEKDAFEMHQAKEDLEKRLVDEKHKLEEYQQSLDVVKKERDHLSMEVTSLNGKISSYQDTEVQKQQEISVLEVECNLLKENMAALEKKLVEETTIASQKNSELLMLQNELHQQESLREKAQELETAKREELERTVSELQAKILEVSTRASERESYLQSELKDQLRAKQSEDDLRRELEEKVGTLQEQLDSVNRCAAEKDNLLGSLDQKLKEMEGLFLQKEKDVFEMHEAKKDLEKRLVDEKHQLEEHQQSLDIVRKERDHLSTEVTSLNEKISSYQDTEVQKQHEISVLEVECNLLKENMAALKKKLVEETTIASQKNSELLMLQNELHQQESLREKAQELETAKQEELERTVSELQAKILEVSTCASEREALLQSELKDQLRAKQSEDDLRRELEEKVGTLQEELDSVNRCTADKDNLLGSLDQKLKEMEGLFLQKEKECNLLKENMAALEKKLVEETTIASQKTSELLMLQNELHQQESLREKAQELETAKHEELERTVSELQAKILEVSTLASERESLQSELKDQLRAKQSEDDRRRELEEKVSTLQEELDSFNRCAADKDNLLGSLDQKLKEMEGLFLKKEKECNLLKENMAALEKNLEYETTIASQKNSEVLMLQNELQQQNGIREKAQDLETAKREELERTLSELQNKILEVSTLASEREAQVISLQNEMNAQESSAKQSKDDLCKELEKVETLQRQLETANHDITDKDQLLQTLNQKLNQTELLCQQKEKVILDIHQVKEDLEKRIDELIVEKQQQLEGSQQSLEMVKEERDHLSTEVTSLNDKIRSYQENEVQKQQEISVLEVKVNTLMENLVALKTEVAELTNTVSQKESEILLLQKEFCEQEKLREKAQDLEKNVSDLQVKIQEVSALASEREAQLSSLHDEMNDQHLRAKQSEDDLRTTLEEKVETLQRQLDTASCDVTDKDHLLQSLDQKLRQVELLCKQKEKDVLEMHQAKEELQKRIVELEVDKHQLDVYQQNLEMLRQERSHLTSLNQSLQRKCDASQKIRAELELKVEEQNGSILALKKASQQWEEQNQELMEQLRIKLEAVEHYKAQMEKAKNHYNGKKQQLVEVQELNQNFERSLEASKREVKALETELKMARMELDQANAKEKKLAAKVKSLEAQVDFTDRHLREQSRVIDGAKDMRRRESHYIRGKYQDTSTDSVDFELNDSLNVNSQSVAPGESSTPLVRSSERLAAKRRGLGSESLETLYFTPMGKQGTKCKVDPCDVFERKLESSISSIGDLVVDSAKKLTASARRRRTTQVINITLAKKTPGSAEGEDSFSSLHSARSQPNLAVHHSRPISIDLSEESLSQPDTLQNLPGYRRSTAHSVAPQRATSTFCIGEENEPEHAADDWMRIAELQARNKACLPHLKSSYPLESRPSLGPSFTVTDEVLRMGDPDETIRRASMVPGQILETLNSRRFSLAPGASSAHSQPQRATMLPGQIRSSTAAHQASQFTKPNTRSPLAPKRPGSQLQDPDTPEAKKLASCFPRPMTPKGRFGNSQNRPPKSPAERRQSVVFTVVNTPKSNVRGDSRLQRGLNKLRNSARKSPAVAGRALRSAVSGRSPMHSTLRKSPRNKSPKSSNAKKGNQ